MFKVAVYGTLKQGWGNHARLRQSRFVGKTTVGGRMYSLGPYPAVQLGNDGKVYCEVYEVNEAVLADLDHLEGVARDFYQREQIDTELGECFIYTMKDVHGYPRVDSGHWGEAA